MTTEKRTRSIHEEARDKVRAINDTDEYLTLAFHVDQSDEIRVILMTATHLLAVVDLHIAESTRST